MKREQLPLPFGPIRNRNFLSNNWLEHRLDREPEWTECRERASQLFARVRSLWVEQRAYVEQYAEATLEQAFIQPMLTILGWQMWYQASLRGSRADYALFLTNADYDAAVRAGRTNPAFWDHATLVGDAKAWGVNLDRPVKVKNKRRYPPEQIEQYMHQSARNFGLLTNGRLWRLYPHDLQAYQPRFETYLEFDLGQLLNRWTEAGGDEAQRIIEEDMRLIDDFLRFYLFFSPAAFVSTEPRQPLMQRAISGSNEYRVGVGEELKGGVFEALRICIQGFLDYAPNGLNSAEHLNLCREHSFVLLYRLLFIMYAEDRDLLPYRTNHLYRENRSLGRLRDNIATQLDQSTSDAPEDSTRNDRQLWDTLTELFDLVDSGGKRYGVPAYNGGLFDPDQDAFLTEKVLPSWYLARVIDYLSRAPDRERPQAGLSRVDYRDLSIQHLGHVYEGLLELQPKYATEPMVVIRKHAQKVEEKVIRASDSLAAGYDWTEIVYSPGDVYLITDKGERRASGSYYTPNDIVDYIVNQTVGERCRAVNAQLESEIRELKAQHARARGDNRILLGRRLAELESDFDDRVLRMKILDPAMGSGHFLLRACQCVAEEIATNPHAGDSVGDHLQSEESILTFWKRRIVEHCLYGVDLNPLAVELAKVALWLETAGINYPLTFLDHHLRCGNSLVGATVTTLNSLPGTEALPLFEDQLSLHLPRVLDGLAVIANRPSDTVELVKEKGRVLSSVVEAIRKPFIAIADLWCATYFLNRADQVTPEQHARALQSIGTRNNHTRVRREPWFQKALQIAHRPDVSCFHWELEFPEVFFDTTGRQPAAGFDVVVGNPPWGHAQSLSILKQFPTYDCVSDDHSECFVCLATALVHHSRGRIGLVLPDTILSPAKKATRQHMLERVKTDAVMNLGPDWFTSDVRMSTVLWIAGQPTDPRGDYQFRSSVLPINTRRAAQGGMILLDEAIRQFERTVDVGECLADTDKGIPLFGNDEAVALVTRITRDVPTLKQVCDHGRGVELNKLGSVVRCPACALWDAPPLKDEQGRFRSKKCTHCGSSYTPEDDANNRILVTSLAHSDPCWKPYIDGDSISRYVAPSVRWLDTSADGINYKPDTLYASPKILIRQAGIGVNAILDQNLSAYCPQSVYLYRVKTEYQHEGLDEPLLLSLLCSRLFHLQVFMTFGEIDSSRAFSKLTHTRLGRMRTVPPPVLKAHPVVVSHLRDCVAVLCSNRPVMGAEQVDWDIEGCWSYLLGLTARDVRCVVQNFGNIHHNETMEALFPGGVSQGAERWIRVWIEAIKRAQELDQAGRT